MQLKKKAKAEGAVEEKQVRPVAPSKAPVPSGKKHQKIKAAAPTPVEVKKKAPKRKLEEVDMDGEERPVKRSRDENESVKAVSVSLLPVFTIIFLNFVLEIEGHEHYRRSRR